MHLIDRFIVRQFLINFLILLFVLTALFVLIDLVVNLDEFLKAARQSNFTNGNRQHVETVRESELSSLAFLAKAIWLIWDWHGPLIVLVYVYLSGLVATAAMGFTFTDLTRKGEIVALVSSGVSMYRVSMPVVSVGCALCITALPIQEMVIPKLASKIARSHRQLGHAGILSFAVRFAQDGQDNLISAASFDPDTQTLSDVNIIERDGSGRPIRFITAGQANWSEAEQRWDLTDGYEQRPMTAEHLLELAEFEPTQVKFFSTSLSPKVLIARRAQIYPSLLSITDLIRIGRNQTADTPSIYQIIHQRFSMMVVNMLVLLMGLPFFLCREPANMLLQAVRAAAMCLGAWTLSLVILQLGRAQLNPIAAAWLPVVVLLPTTAWLLLKIKT